MKQSIVHIGIGGKIAIISIVFAALFLVSVIGYLAVESRAQLVASADDAMQVFVDNERQKIDTLAEETVKSIIALSQTPPFQGIIRARDAEGYDAVDKSSYEQWQARLEQIFIAQMQSKGSFYQFRYLDEEGNEMVRVNYLEDELHIVRGSELQNKAGRDYFEGARILAEGEVYVSKAELNKEGEENAISDPPTGVVRYATPIYSGQDGTFRGVLVANLLVSEFLVRISDLELRVPGEAFIADNGGFFIRHPDVQKQWGAPYDYNTGHNAKNEFPQFSTFTNDLGSHNDGEHLMVYATAHPDPANQERRWTIVKRIPLAIIFADTNTLVWRSAVIGLGAFFLLALIFLGVISFLLKPLSTLAAAAARVGAGDFSRPVSVQAKDEIGSVAEGFNAMMQKLKLRYGGLEQAVEEKTAQLSAQVAELEETRTAMLNVLEDLEEEREEVVAQSKEVHRFKQAVDGATDAMIMTTPDMKIVYVNSAWETLTGYTKSEAIGKTPKILQSGKTPDEVYGTLFQSIAKGEAFHSEEFINKRKDGTEYDAALSVFPILDEGVVKFYVGVQQDITQRKEVDRAKTEFVSLASHQLRTPLSAIRWYSEMLDSEDVGSLTKEQKEYLGEIQHGTLRMIELVNALLNVSRVDLGTLVVEPELLDIVALTKDIVKGLQPKIGERRITFTEKYDAIAPLYVDKKLMHMVIENLCSNAVKYTPEGGSVDCAIKQKAGAIEITVADSGLGIPKSQQDKIFSKLFRADNVRSSDTDGTGLGLYLAKKVVDQVGGSIVFESPTKKTPEGEGYGTTFIVTIPVKDTDA